MAPAAAITLLSSYKTSPFEPSPAESNRSGSSTTGHSLDFTQIKIRLRDREGKRKAEKEDSNTRPRTRQKLAMMDSAIDDINKNQNLLGRDDISVRFQFST